MTDKPISPPGPDHPIQIEQIPVRIKVAVDGQLIAATRNALTLWEANYPPVHDILLSDVDTGMARRTDHHTYCPDKGGCSYYTVMAGGPRTASA